MEKTILTRAMALVNSKKSAASIQRKSAFANSVSFLVTGQAGGYGGPTVREFAVRRRFGGKMMSFEEATRLLLDDNGLIFWPLQDIHNECWEQEKCFDDDPEDLAKLKASSSSTS